MFPMLAVQTYRALRPDLSLRPMGTGVSLGGVVGEVAIGTVLTTCTVRRFTILRHVAEVGMLTDYTERFDHSLQWMVGNIGREHPLLRRLRVLTGELRDLGERLGSVGGN